jgi:hypothetical protein
VPTAATPEEKLSASRWSDIDDVLMFTAKAKDGQWFRGRVPLALLKIHAGQSINDADWFTDVSVASEYAEIVWFMRPLNETGGLNVDPSLTPPQLVNTPVIDTIPVVDRTGDGVPDPDGMPDRIALCRRVLLIRPDLNIELPWGVTGDPQKLCLPLPFSNQDEARLHMRYPFQRCDLSVRAINQLDLSNTANSRLVLRTNSLADLQNPENRFAHYVTPFDHPQFGLVSSLPALALTYEFDFSNITSYFGQMIANAIGADFSGVNLTPFDQGFIPSQLFRTKVGHDSNWNIISVRPTLEEIVASNVVGFDVRGYDGSVQQLASRGTDGIWGASDNQADAGAAGTDDLVVSPSDPGFALQVINNEIVPISTGAFVDLCWGRRVLNQFADASLAYTIPGRVPSLNSLPPNDQRRSLFVTPLSGFETYIDPSDNVRKFRITDSMRLSGRFRFQIPLINDVYQPTFDTFTDFYESDGNRQLGGFSANGLVRYGGSASTNNPTPDQGIDGIDNPPINGAIDDELELETRPPIVYPMPAIQVKFRIQDVPAGTLQEISMVHDLMGN